MKAWFLWFVLISPLNASREVPVAPDLNFMREIPLLLGIFNQSLTEDSTSSCHRDISTILTGVFDREIWALKILDASGRRNPAFMLGSNFWLGSEIACRGANSPLHIATTDDPELGSRHWRVLNAISPVEVNYRIVMGKIEGDLRIALKLLFSPLLHVGLCIPKSCSNEFLMRVTQDYFGQNPTFGIIKTNVTVERVIEIKPHGDFTGDFTFLIAGTLLFATLSLCFFAHRLESKPREHMNILSRMISCFSIRQNFRCLMNNEVSANTIVSLNLLRTVSSVWVIVVHVMFLQLWLSDSLTVSSVSLLKPRFLFLWRGMLSVDVFFIIGGFLSTFNFLKNEQLGEEIRSNGFRRNCGVFLRYLSHRYIRLTPIAFIAMLISRLTYLSNNDTVFRDYRESFGFNNINWHYNLLYIQNFIPHAEISFVWTWSLACEMQFYIYSLVLLFIYSKSRRWGIVTFVVSTAATVTASFIIMYRCNTSMKFLDAFRDADMVYIKPWTRISSYQSGMMLGFILHVTRGRRIYLSPRHTAIIWSAILGFFTVTVAMDPDQPKILMQLFMSGGRILYGLIMGGIIVICHWGYGRWFEWLSTRRFIQQFSKLSYTIYLLHPAIGMKVYGTDAHVANISFIKTLFDSLGIAIVSYYLSHAITILFELPYIRLSDEFILKRRSRYDSAESHKNSVKVMSEKVH
ncbi:nose resistant to fluoxetine protein 6-like isoform X2 [Phlebotomus argentipes]|uniref:nose resistant to fluoxetine protein 6-like isoform X2 n=1 Tax=Phlebotomus argentipes TaxID=94469 RepID=UPI0028931AAC|nr:nose resistant to fluoxetine protein 6-like isoform X2 [Phlebotomus argentipes]